MFFRKKKAPEPREFDRENFCPVIRCSICTGEEVAGFRNKHTGKFTEDRLLRSEQDLLDFMEQYGLQTVPPREY